MNDSSRPTWFTGVVFLAIAWNLIGVLQFFAHITITPEQLMEMPLAQQELIKAMPAWVNAAFAVAVFSGLLGSILLMMKKAIAFHLFLVSMLAVLIQNYYSLFIGNAIQVMGSSAMAFPIIIILIAALLIWFSLKAKTKGWIS